MRKKKKGNENDENPAKEHEERAITVIRFFALGRFLRDDLNEAYLSKLILSNCLSL